MRRIASVSLALLLADCQGVETLEVAGTGDPDRAGWAVVCSDFESTAIAILDLEGQAETAPLLLHSGIGADGLTLGLGGDVDLPTRLPRDGSVLLLDRFPESRLTWVDPVSGQVERQLDLSEGGASNPHDALELVDGRWLVTRCLSDDLLVLDEGGAIIESRSTTEDDGWPGRPDRVLEVAGELWVSLLRVSGDYSTWRDGRILRLDPGSLEPIGPPHDLPGAINCGELATHEGAGEVAVVCSGSFTAGEIAPIEDKSALLLLDLGGTELGRLGATDPRVGASFGDGVALQGDGSVLVVVFGQPGGAPDRVLRWDPEGETVEVVHIASGPFLASTLAQGSEDLVLVPEADPASPRLCRLGGPAPDCLPVCTATGLPPRALRPLSRPD